MKTLNIIADSNKCNGAVIGNVRELSNGNWAWHGLGRSSKKTFKDVEQAKSAAKRAFGKVRFEEI